MPKPRILSIGAIAMLAVLWLGMKVPVWLELEGRPWVWGVRSAVWILGALAVALVIKLLPKGSGTPASKAEPDVLDALVTQATKRLHAIGARGGLARLPVVLVLGPRGSAKTTFVQRSDLDADLLAGSPVGDSAVPTDAVNLWYRDGQVLVEAGGQLSVDPGRWARLVEKLRPRQLIPALLGRSQAPRVAVVCYSVDDLTGPGSGDSHLAAARNLRARLTELAERIGIRLPVYVVFTKTDRVPHFEEFAKNLTDAEVHDLLGATLRSSGDLAPAGSYAEKETERLGRAFDELFHGLSERRLEVLSRSGATQGNGMAYEFPREFRKLSKSAIPFLLELCRPNQLRVSPFLRGFYFAGVRPVVAREDVHQPMQTPAFGQASPSGATQVFRLEDLQAKAPARAAAFTRPGDRRVPQWVFMDRILQRVVFMDRVATGITTSSVSSTAVPRVAMAAGIVISLGLIVVVVRAFTHEKSLQSDVWNAIAAVEGVAAAAAGLAPADQLQRLDSLRAVTATLSRFENDDRPPRDLIGMYTGHTLYSEARSAYFDHFRPLLLQRALDGVKADLGDLPDAPTSDRYDRVYRSLKAYVEMTAETDRAQADFMGEVLTDRWLGPNVLDDQRPVLARKQFEFYGAELPYGNPYPGETADPAILTFARAFLRNNATEDAFYQSMVGQFNNSLAPARLASDRPDTREVLVAPFDVLGAFTRIGWDSVQAKLTSVDQSFRLEPHVVEREFYESLESRGIDPDSLPRRLQQRYEREYRDTWLRFLRDSRLEGVSVQGARERLIKLGSNQSALFQLFAFVHSHTAVENDSVSGPFAVLKIMLGPDSLPQQLVSEKPGYDYLRLVGALADAVGRMNEDPRANVGGLATASQDGIAFVREQALKFPFDPMPFKRASDGLDSLLSAPFRLGAQIATGGPKLAVMRAGEDFCRVWRPVLEKYPFRSDASADATVDEVNSLLNPQSGEYLKFIQTVDGERVATSTDYNNFKRVAGEIANVLYRGNATVPNLRFGVLIENLVGDQRVDIAVGTQVHSFAINRQETKVVEWNPGSQVTVTVQTGVASRPTEDLQLGADPWKLFRFFRQTSWNEVRDGVYRVTWPPVAGVNMLADVVMPVPVLDPDYLRGFTCPRLVAR